MSRAAASVEAHVNFTVVDTDSSLTPEFKELYVEE